MNKKLKHGAVSVVSVVIVLVIAIFLNITLSVLDGVFDLSVDLSTSQMTTIDDISKSVLAELDGPVEIIINGNEQEYRTARYETAEVSAESDTTDVSVEAEETQTTTTTAFSSKRYTYELTDNFRKNSQNISVIYIDSRYNPGFFKERGITLADDVFITVYSPQTRRSFFIYNDVFASSELIGLERRIDAGIRSVTKDDIKTVGILTGHNETSFPYLSVLLQNNAYSVDTVDITAVDTLSDKADILVIANPTVSYSADDIKLLRAFLFNNGEYGKHLFVFGDADMPANPLLEEFLETEWGLKLEHKYVFDPANTSTSTSLNDPFMRLAYGTSDLASDVSGELAAQNNRVAVTVGKARQVSLAFDNKDGVYTCQLLKTIGQNAFSKASVDPNNFPPQQRDSEDESGSLIVGAMSYLQRSSDQEDQYSLTSSGVCLFGSTSLLDTYYISNMSGNTSATADYLLNLLRYVSHDESAVKITAQSLITGTMEFDSDNLAKTVSAVCIITIPAVCVVLCIAVWLRRKNL